MLGSNNAGRGRWWTVAAIAAALVALVAAALVGQQFAARRDGSAAASPSPTATPTDPVPLSPSPTPTATISPASGLITHENPILGYRISLPANYRRSGSSIGERTEFMGADTFTTLTEADERAECLRDGSDIPDRSLATYLSVEAHRNPDRLSAAQWASASPRSTHHTVEPLTVNGLDAARLVQQGQTSSYVIAANERIYVISPSMWPSQHALQDIAASFRAIAPQAFPSPTAPPMPPREAARALGQRLAQAFAAKDADAVAALMPDCRIAVVPYIGGSPQGSVLHRSVALFVPLLRDRFARGDLTVTVDPAVQSQVEGGHESFFVRSDWREPDRTTRIDLFLEEREGRWEWVLAVHHYASLVGNYCIPYRTPWVSETDSC